jgi:hypothetical protein
MVVVRLRDGETLEIPVFQAHRDVGVVRIYVRFPPQRKVSEVDRCAYPDTFGHDLEG